MIGLVRSVSGAWESSNSDEFPCTFATTFYIVGTFQTFTRCSTTPQRAVPNYLEFRRFVPFYSMEQRMCGVWAFVITISMYGKCRECEQRNNVFVMKWHDEPVRLSGKSETSIGMKDCLDAPRAEGFHPQSRRRSTAARRLHRVVPSAGHSEVTTFRRRDRWLPETLSFNYRNMRRCRKLS